MYSNALTSLRTYNVKLNFIITFDFLFIVSTAGAIKVQSVIFIK